MKKLFCVLAVVAMGITLLTSCDKEKQIESLTPPVQFKAMDGWGIHRTWCGECGVCYPPEKGCFDDVVVTPKDNLFLQSIFSEGAAGVKKFFSDGLYKDYFPELGLKKNWKYLQKLQNGEYEVRIEIEKTSTFYLLQNSKDKEDQFQFVVVTE